MRWLSCRKNNYEVVANLVLQSISVWEDLHLYALTYSAEYNNFWELLDESLKETVCRYRRQYREERLVPFSMSLINYYKGLLTKENFERIRGLHWRKQLKIIMADNKFRIVMTRLNLSLREDEKEDTDTWYTEPASRTATSGFSAHSRTDAFVLFNYV